MLRSLQERLLDACRNVDSDEAIGREEVTPPPAALAIQASQPRQCTNLAPDRDCLDVVEVSKSIPRDATRVDDSNPSGDRPIVAHSSRIRPSCGRRPPVSSALLVRRPP